MTGEMTGEPGVKLFLENAGWGASAPEALRADFSTRRFSRLRRKGQEPNVAILMQAAPDQKTEQFVAMAHILRQCGLSAPQVYAANPQAGLALMEDFGDATLGSLLDQGLAPEPVYASAANVLARLHKVFDRKAAQSLALPTFTVEAFVEQACLFLDFWFVQRCARSANEQERVSFQRAWREALAPVAALPQTLMLRDFMPDNLMALSERQGVQAVGLLDFQDGGFGPVAYDLASLGECVRRDVDDERSRAMIAFYLRLNPELSEPAMAQACSILSAQRHCRVLGILARLAVLQCRQDKMALAPRVLAKLQALLETPALEPVKRWANLSADCKAALYS